MAAPAHRVLPLFMALALFLLAPACADKPSQTSKSTELILVEAGFTMKEADTKAKMDHLKTLPQRHIFKAKKKGQTVYVYADATYCQCICVGDAYDYKRFRTLAWNNYIQQGDNQLAAMTDNNVDFFVDWGTMGFW